MNQTAYTQTRELSAFANVFLKLMGSSTMRGEDIQSGITRLLSNYSSDYLIAVGNGQYLLIDTGTDKNATEILGYLRSQDANADSVVAVFITHAHADHIAGTGQFPKATIYIGSDDRAALIGEAKSDGMLPGLAGKLKHPAVADVNKIIDVKGGETITIGDTIVQVFAIPGHTRGSMGYLAKDALFVGDALTFDKSGKIKYPPSALSMNVKLARNSIVNLVRQLDERSLSPRIIVPSHSGTGTFDAIKNL